MAVLSLVDVPVAGEGHMPTEPDVSPPVSAVAVQIVHARARRVRSGALAAAVAVAVVVFIVTCVLVGESVSSPTHARAHGDVASELPPAGSAIGMIAVLMAVALSLLATVVVLSMLLQSRSSGEDHTRECAAEEGRG
jgi:preprotein translocase subunit SecG